jgi:hypothetical protein
MNLAIKGLAETPDEKCFKNGGGGRGHDPGF